MSPERQPNYPAQPLRPAEVLAAKVETIPDEAFIAMNGLITERLHGEFARVTVKALIGRMVELGLDRKEIKQRGWDRLGSIYKEAGWEVTYNSPSMDDNDYDPYYYFKTKGTRSW